MNAEAFLTTIADWAQSDERVLAAALCGSHARGDAGPGSDIDVCIVASDPESLLSDRSWLELLGQGPRVAGPIEDYGLVQSLRVRYGALEAELGIASEKWMDLPIDSGTARVMNDGLRVLHDPEGRLRRAVAFAASMTE